MNRSRDMAIQNYARRLTAVILDLVQPEIAPFDPTTSKTLPVPENPTLGSNAKSIGRPVPEIWPYEIFNGATGNSAIRSTDLKNPTIEPNMKWIGWTIAEIWPFEIFQNARSVGRSVLNITLLSYTPLRYVRNVAREEYKSFVSFFTAKVERWNLDIAQSKNIMPTVTEKMIWRVQRCVLV